MAGPDEQNTIKLQYSDLAGQRDALFSDYQSRSSQPLTSDAQVDAINSEVDQINGLDTQLDSLSSRYDVVRNQYQEGTNLVQVFDPTDGSNNNAHPIAPKQPNSSSGFFWILLIAYFYFSRR